MQVDKLVQETLDDFDLDGDGCLDYLEFKRSLFDSPIEEILTIQLL